MHVRLGQRYRLLRRIAKDFLVVAFRGTQPGQWQDVLADANLVQAPSDYSRVHLGFKNAFSVIRPQLDPLACRR